MSEHTLENGLLPSLSPETVLEVEAEPTIEQLPALLGFEETSELRELKALWVEGMIAGSDVYAINDSYHVLAEEVVNRQIGTELEKSAQIGKLIQIALIRRDAGRLEDFIADLNDAADYAHGLGSRTLVSLIDKIINEQVV